jgi:NitT/TauT family transport system permease protein
MSRRALVGLLRAAFLVGAASALEYFCRSGRIPRLTMIPPSEMAEQLALGLWAGTYTADIAFTFANIGAAAAVSILLGAALGLAIHALPRLRILLEPLLASYYSVPTFVFYPLLIVLLGLSRWPLVAIGAMFGVVAMILNTINGLDRIPRVMVKSARVFRLSRWDAVWRVKLPAATPSLFTGVKLAVTYSVIGVIAGEFILSVAGLGRRIKFAYDNLDNQAMYALLLFVLTATVLVYFLVHGWERRVHRRWTNQ